MKKSSLQRLIGAFMLTVLGFTATDDSWARLPKPIEATAIVLAVDVESKTLVVKFGLGEKLALFDWDDKTEFRHGEQPVTPSAVKVGVTVALIYKEVSFRNPRLKRVSISEDTRST